MAPATSAHTPTAHTREMDHYPGSCKHTYQNSTALVAVATTANDVTEGADARPAHRRFGHNGSFILKMQILDMSRFCSLSANSGTLRPADHTVTRIPTKLF